MVETRGWNYLETAVPLNSIFSTLFNTVSLVCIHASVAYLLAPLRERASLYLYITPDSIPYNPLGQPVT